MKTNSLFLILHSTVNRSNAFYRFCLLLYIIFLFLLSLVAYYFTYSTTIIIDPIDIDPLIDILTEDSDITTITDPDTTIVQDPFNKSDFCKEDLFKFIGDNALDLFILWHLHMLSSAVCVCYTMITIDILFELIEQL